MVQRGALLAGSTPGNRLGLFLLALAVAWPWSRFRERPMPLLRSIGVLASSVVFLLVFYVS